MVEGKLCAGFRAELTVNLLVGEHSCRNARHDAVSTGDLACVLESELGDVHG